MLGVAAYAATTLGDGDPGTAQAPQEESQQTNSPDDAEGQDAQPAANVGGQTSAENEREDTSTGDAGTSGAAGGSSEEDPAQVVREFYQAAVDKDFGRSSGLMTPEWRQIHFPEQDRFQNTYFTLRGIEWAEGPTTTEVSGNAATVTGVTIARHTNRTERNAGTWTLVYENGEWRINGWNVNNISTEYA